MNRMMRGLAFAGALAAGLANAGTVEQAHVFADPQMQVKDGALQGCGYRIKGLVNFSPASNSAIALDISFNAYSSGLALMKGGAMEFTLKNGQKPSGPITRPIDTFWMKAADARPTKPMKGLIVPAETKGYVLYSVDFEEVMKLFEAVWDRKPLTMGARIKGEPVDRIYTGVAKVSDADLQQVQQCTAELAQQMQHALEAEGSKPQ